MKRGSIMLETVLVMPVLLMIIFAIVQFAHVWTARQMVAYAAFCATRATMVVPNVEKQNAAQNAAEIALSWINLCDDPDSRDSSGFARDCITMPGWGKIGGSGKSRESKDWSNKRVKVEVVANGEDDSNPIATTRVYFRFPLVVPGMVVNKIIGERNNGANRGLVTGNKVNLYDDIVQAAANVATIDGWPYIELTETCTLPMPYSTARFPKGAFNGVNIRK